MTLAALLAHLRERGAVLAVAGDRVRIDAPRGTLTRELLEELCRHKKDLLRLLSASRGRTLPPGCLYDYAHHRKARAVLRCVTHPGCPREVVLWRDGLLAEMFSLERLVGAARRDGETEWLAKQERAG